jgi:hypothetical protein
MQLSKQHNSSPGEPIKHTAARMMQGRAFWFRAGILIFAGVLAVQASWLVIADFFRPILPYFPHHKVSGERAAAVHSAAVTAASISWIRGDLWTDAAIALWNGLISEVAGERSDPQLKPQRDQARAAVERAARLSPQDSRTWLLLAALDSRFDRPNRQVVKYLKMSYLTGPNEMALIPLRLHIATSSTVINDAELQSLVAQEIRLIVLRHQVLKPSLLAAYRDASPEGRSFIETTVGDLDKNLLAAIRGGR